MVDEYSYYAATSAESLIHILDRTRKYGLNVAVALQHTSQMGKALDGAFQNCDFISFGLGEHDAAWAASYFTEYEPFKQKHDPLTGRVSYSSLAEQKQMTALTLQRLERQQALVRIGNRIETIQTLSVAPGTTDSTPIIDRYEHTRLRRPPPPVTEGAPRTKKVTVRREEVREAIRVQYFD